MNVVQSRNCVPSGLFQCRPTCKFVQAVFLSHAKTYLTVGIIRFLPDPFRDIETSLFSLMIREGKLTDSCTMELWNGWLIIGLTTSVIFIFCENTLNIDIVEIKGNFAVRNGSSNICAIDTLSILLVFQLSKIHEWNLTICLVERVRNCFSVIFTQLFRSYVLILRFL